MTPDLIVAAIVEIVKLINFYNATLSPDEAKLQTARMAKVLDFLFGWLDKIHATAPAAVAPK
jgi:hypothetical protein